MYIAEAHRKSRVFAAGLHSVAGRLDQTWYPAAFGDAVSIFDMHLRPGPSDYPRPDCPHRPASACPRAVNPGVTHRYYTGQPVLPFGFGLSYTTFEYGLVAAPAGLVSLDPLRRVVEHAAAANRTFLARDQLLGAAAAPLEPAGLVRYQVNVTNTGLVDSDDAVLGFMRPPGAGEGGVPLQVLLGFSRVHVKAGRTELVELYPETMLEFSQVGTDGRRYVLPGEYTVRIGVEETAALGGGFFEHTFTAV